MGHQILIFLSLALSIYYGLHALLYLLLIKIFHLTSWTARIRLMAGVLLLSLSFLISFFLARLGGLPFPPWFYYGSALWLGALINLLIVLGLGLLFHTLLIGLSMRIDLRSFGFILLGLASFMTLYGLFQAGNIKIRQVTVPIKNLPSHWQGKKIAHISDLHLGILAGKSLTSRISEKINDQQVDLVCITGDLFDGTGDHLADSVAPFNQITVPIYYVIGNHETYLGLARTFTALGKTHLKVLRDEIIDLGGIQLVGLDFPQRGHKKNPEPVLKMIDRSKPAILLFHEPSNREIAAQYNISLQLSGHTHNGQFWPLKIFTYLIYKGYDYGLHRISDFYLYTTSGVGTWGPPMRIGSTPEIAVITLY
jgi:predicted MPP superfamily phosphohydrolase